MDIHPHGSKHSNLSFVPVAALAVAFAVLLLAAPAEACGCGGYIPREGDASVAQERALLRYGGQTEDIVMTFDLRGSSQEAAFIMPVPERATFQLGDPKLFTALQDWTKPRVETVRRWAFPMLGAGAEPPPAGAAPVTLLDRQTIGPYDVSQLAATDANALGDWLKANGYVFEPTLANAMRPYVEKGWLYVAVRLTPGANSQTLQGVLDPLWVTFHSAQLVYPMRASANAKSPLPVILYVLADHRVSKAQSFGPSRVSFADWIEPGMAGLDPALAPLVTRRFFLTKFEDRVTPAAISDDFYFSPSASDEIYHDVTYTYIDDYTPFLIVLACLALAVIVPFLVVIGLGIAWLGRRIGRAA